MARILNTTSTVKQTHLHFPGILLTNFGSVNLAQALHISESQLYRKLRAITGKSSAVFIRSVRLQKAKELILTTNRTISEISYDVGFNDPSWVSWNFKQEFGISPSEFKKKQQIN